MSDSLSLFDSLAALTREKRTLKIARPSDIIDEPTPANGRPQVFKLKPGAQTIDIEIHGLTADERAKGEQMFNTVTPQRMFKENKDGSKVPAGWDEEDPDYRAKRAVIERKHMAYVALTGCPSLAESTTGANLEEKIIKLTASLDERVILFIATSILGFDLAGGDAADFLSIPASADSPS